jgi:hypothetical protein
MSDSQGHTNYGLLLEGKAGFDPAGNSLVLLLGKERCFGPYLAAVLTITYHRTIRQSAWNHATGGSDLESVF